MSTRRTVRAALIMAAQARWGRGVVCVHADALVRASRCTGPAVVIGRDLLVLGAPNRATVYSLDTLLCGRGTKLEARGTGVWINDLLLTVYTVNGRHTAYERSARRTLGSYRPAGASRRPRPIARLRQGAAARPASSAVAAAVAAALALAACSSHTKLVTPDGSDRTAVNTPESLQRYQDLVARQNAMTLEKSSLQSQVDSLSSQVTALKSYILQQQKQQLVPVGPAVADPGAPKAVPQSYAPPARPANPVAVAAATTTADSPNLEAVAVGKGSVTFRLNQGVGRTDFAPSSKFETELLKAAREAKTILIRGRTDADASDPAEVRVALGRALRARAFLIRNGIPSSKIRAWYRSSGDFIADNSTASGKAQNRRVEIEARGVDPSGYSAIALNETTASN